MTKQERENGGKRWAVTAAVTFALLGIALITVSYANPEFIEDHPSVDLNDEPDEVAHDALMNLSARDYTLTQRLRRWNETTETWETRAFLRYKIENTNERYSILLGEAFWGDRADMRTSKHYEPDDRFYPSVYANEGSGWDYKGTALVRGVAYREEYVNPDLDAMATDWHVHEENETHLVLRTESPNALDYNEVIESNGLFDGESYVNVYVDKNEKRVSMVVVKQVDVNLLSEKGFEPAETGDMSPENVDEFDFSNFSVYHSYNIYEMSDFGETRAERPKEAPRFSISEVLYRITSEHRRR